MENPPNLNTHIDQVAAHQPQRRNTIALCGHSYAGLVIAGVADRLGDRLDHLIFIDAYVPEDGDSCWSPVARHPVRAVDRTPTHRPTWQFHEIPVGHNIARRDPHSLATLLGTLAD